MPHTASRGWVALRLSAVQVSTARWLLQEAWTGRKSGLGMGVWRCCGVRFYPCQLFTWIPLLRLRGLRAVSRRVASPHHPGALLLVSVLLL
jgi:hypothetical protein